MADVHFAAFLVVSFLGFLAILRIALRRRAAPPSPGRVAWVSFVVVVVGMVFAKWGATHGLHWLIYYGLPAATTILLPPFVFRLRNREVVEYVAMACAIAPAIHVLFSFFLGWNEYMPFLHVPSIGSLV